MKNNLWLACSLFGLYAAIIGRDPAIYIVGPLILVAIQELKK